MCRESHPLCRLRNPTVVSIITRRLSSCGYNVHLLMTIEGSSKDRKKERKKERKKKERKKKVAVVRSVTRDKIFGIT